MITGGLIMWGADRANDVLATYRDLTENAPRELTVAVVMRLAPPPPFIPEDWHFRPVIAMLVCHSGPDPSVDLTPIHALTDPIVDLITEKPYVEQQSMMDGSEPKGEHYYWKTEHLSALSSGFLDAFAAGALKVPTVASESVIFHIGGAQNENDDDDGAVGNRDSRYITGFAGAWTADDQSGEHVAWVRDAWASIRPFSTGGNYVNFQLAEDDSGRTAEAYGRNYERLQRIKAEYDPENLFRMNRNIAPLEGRSH
jgi:hypothetical protein